MGMEHCQFKGCTSKEKYLLFREGSKEPGVLHIPGMTDLKKSLKMETRVTLLLYLIRGIKWFLL
jgi:hypothetical protein